MRIIVFTKRECPFCVKAKAWLDSHMIPFEVEDVSDDGLRQALYDELGLVGKERTVPQILLVANGVTEHIKGYDGLVNSGLENRATIDLEEFLE